MANLIAPIYTATLNGRPLRFFKAPLTTPHIPWHSYDDLLRCIGVKQWIRDEVLEVIRTGRSGDVRTVACQSEILIITPHYAAKWFINNLRGKMKFRQQNEIQYLKETYNAWHASVRGIPGRDDIDLYFLALENTHRAAGAGWLA